MSTKLKKDTQEKPFLLRQENRYLWYILVIPVYLISFYIVELVVDPDKCWVSYMPIDDQIPFLEGFIVPYMLWFLQIAGVGLFLLLKDHDAFRRYMIYVGLSFMTCLLCYLIWPNKQLLRVEEFPRENIFTWIVSIAYGSDTNTNVCPSLHVIGSFAAVFGAFDCKELRKKPWILALLSIAAFFIAISTVFVKQHSLLDILVAIPYCLIFWVLVYVLPPRIRKRRNKD